MSSPKKSDGETKTNATTSTAKQKPSKTSTKNEIVEESSSIIKDQNVLMKEMALFKSDNNKLKKNINIHKAISKKSKGKILMAVKRTKYIPSIIDVLIECKNVYDSAVKILKEENLQLIKLQQVKSVSTAKRNVIKKKPRAVDDKKTTNTNKQSESDVNKELDEMEKEILNMMDSVPNENTNDVTVDDDNNINIDEKDDVSDCDNDVDDDSDDMLFESSSSTPNKKQEPIEKHTTDSKNTVLINKKNLNRIKENNVNILLSMLGDVVENLSDVAMHQAKLFDELVESDNYNKMIIEQQDQRLDNIENSLLSQFKSMYDDAKRRDAAYIYSKRPMMTHDITPILFK